MVELPSSKAADGSTADLLAQNAVEKGNDLPEDELKLAKAIDRARELLPLPFVISPSLCCQTRITISYAGARVNSIDKAGEKGDKKGLDQAVKKDPTAITDLGDEAASYLGDEPDRLKTAAGKASHDLADVRFYLSAGLFLA